jgi:hypothetical protein
MLNVVRRVRSGLRYAVPAVAAAAALAPATAIAAPPTLTGETLSDPNPTITGTCDPSRTSDHSFQAMGLPLGPYSGGSFAETGTATVGPQPDYQGGGSFPHGDLTELSATFSVTTPDAVITGIKEADASSAGTGVCRQVSGDPDVGNATFLSAEATGLRYRARIVTAEGTFLDRGTAYLHVDRYTTDLGFPFAGFTETFESSLSEPVRAPTSAEECKRSGFQWFDFKNQGACVAYVNHGE